MGITERKAREKEQRRNAIIDAAEKIFFSGEMDTATMDDIAEAAELSKGTLYLYFKGKEDLYLAITRRGLDILIDMFSKAVKKKKYGIQKIYAIGKAYYSFSIKHPDYFNAMTNFLAHCQEFDKYAPTAMECALAGDKPLIIVRDSLIRGIEDGTIRSDINPSETAIILMGQSNGLIQILSKNLEHFKNMHPQFNLKSAENIIDHAYNLIRRSLEPST